MTNSIQLRIANISDTSITCVSIPDQKHYDLPKALMGDGWSQGDECTMRITKGTDDQNDEKKAILNELLGTQSS